MGKMLKSPVLFSLMKTSKCDIILAKISGKNWLLSFLKKQSSSLSSFPN